MNLKSRKKHSASSTQAKTEPALTPAATTYTDPRPSQVPAPVATAKTPAQPKQLSTPKTQPAPQSKRPNPVVVELVHPEAKHVFVAGSFNDWKADQTPLTPAGNGRWVGNLAVGPGRHEYLFVVDGKWIPDPSSRELVENPFGGKNSVLVVSE
jgi:hypothetical protein